MIRRSSLLALVLAASGAALGTAAAEEPAPFDPGDLALLPVDDVQRAYLLRDHPELAARVMILGHRAERVARHLRERPDATDEGSRGLREELARIREQFRPLVAEMRRILPAYGVDASAFDRVARAPRGPLAQERFAHALVLDAPGLDERVRDLFRSLVPATDGALLALHAQREETARAPEGAEVPAEARDRAVQAIETRSKAIERRFWRTVDVLLDTPSRAWVRRFLPSKKTQHADVLGHLYRLPGLTVDQGVRLKALLVEIDSESAPDRAEVRRIDARLAEAGVEGGERRDLEGRKERAGRRLQGLHIAAYERGRAILTPEQFEEFRAVPPEVTSEDRLRNPKEIVESLDLTPEQGARIQALVARYDGDRKRIEQAMLRVALRARDTGAESPEQDEVTMMYAGVQVDVAAVVRRATRELFLDVLAPDQVTGWVLGAAR